MRDWKARQARERTLGRLLTQRAEARRKRDYRRVGELEREIREVEQAQKVSTSLSHVEQFRGL